MRACLALFLADSLAHLVVLLGAEGFAWSEGELGRIYFQVCGTTILAGVLCLPMWFHSLVVRNFGWALLASLLVTDISAYAHEVNAGYPPGLDELHYLATPLQVLRFAGTSLVAPVLALVVGLVVLFGLRELSRSGARNVALSLRVAVLVLVTIAGSGVWPLVVVPSAAHVSPVVSTILGLLRFDRALPRQSPLAAAESLQRLTRGEPLPGATPTTPFCRGAVSKEDSSHPPKSILVILVPSVGREEFEQVVEQRRVFARLHELSENGISMHNVVAPGRSLDDALLALFTGQLPLLGDRSLSSVIVPSMTGLASVLGVGGFETAFLASETMLTEERRKFLREVGFDLVIGARPSPPGNDATQPHSTTRQLLSEVEPTLEVLRAGDEQRPTLLVVMLDDVSRAKTAGASSAGEHVQFEMTDAALADFLAGDSLAAFSQPRATMLIGTHVPVSRNAIRSQLGVPLAFDIPLLAFGLDEKVVAPELRFRLGSLSDVGATLVALAGLAPGRCDSGVDLFSQGRHFPRERLVYAVVPEAEEIYVFLTNRLYWRYSLRGGQWTMAKELKGQELMEVLLPLGQEHPDPRLALTAAETRRQQLVEAVAPLSHWDAARVNALQRRRRVP